MTDEFDGYRKWLGISNKNRLPSHYELLAISLDEDDPEVIRAAIEQRRHFVESKRGDGHDSVVTEILYRIGEAETTLLNSEMRRDYDRQLNLFEKRRKNRQVDPFAPRSRVKSQPGPTVGEDHGILNTFAGIMAIVCVAFGIMAWFSFQLPWKKIEVEVAQAPVQQPVVAQPPVQQPVVSQPPVQAPPLVGPDEPLLRSGQVTLAAETLEKGGHTIVIRLQDKSGELTTSLLRPIALELVDARGNVKWIDSTYLRVSGNSTGLTCVGEIVTASNTRFVFEDKYTPHNDTGSFKLQRTVRVEQPSQQDVAFMTRFSIPVVPESKLSDTQCFVPGIWYINNDNLPPTALASDGNDEVFLFREDRLPLPLVMLRQTTSGATFAVVHSNPDGATFLEEGGLQRIVDDRMQFGSLGLYASRTHSIAFVFPGTEGAKTYVSGASQQKRWSLRSHPVRSDVQHSYDLIVRGADSRSVGNLCD